MMKAVMSQGIVGCGWQSVSHPRSPGVSQHLAGGRGDSVLAWSGPRWSPGHRSPVPHVPQPIFALQWLSFTNMAKELQEHRAHKAHTQLPGCQNISYVEPRETSSGICFHYCLSDCTTASHRCFYSNCNSPPVSVFLRTNYVKKKKKKGISEILVPVIKCWSH